MPVKSWRRIRERYGLNGSKCETCNTYYFPTRHFCKKCRRKGKLVSYKFNGRGNIFSFSLVTSPPSGFKLESPYMIAIVEIEEGPMLMSQIVDWHGKKELKIGDPVEVVFRKIREDGPEGIIHYGFKFKPVVEYGDKS
ncbi:MAG: Zn-ribbon domain-containing OB-fold protein [Candidatus Micrarchaeota archaeon]